MKKEDRALFESMNVVDICKRCGDERRTKFQRLLEKRKVTAQSFVGSCVKLAFRDEQKVEHMWVRVQRMESPDRMYGILDNEPVLVENVEFGDQIEFSLEELEGCCPAIGEL